MQDVSRSESVSWTPGRFRTGLAVFLSMVPCVGGLGYLTLRKLGQVSKAIRLFVLILVIWLINGAVVIMSESDWPGMVLTPLAFSLQALSAVDCLLLAIAARQGKEIPKGSVSIAALQFLAR